MPKKTRPPARPPAGHLTIPAAARELGVSYATVYRHKAETAFVTSAAGVIFIPRADLHKIEAALRPPAEDDRRTIQVRIPEETAVEWERKAGRGRPLATWLRQLAEGAT